MLGNAQIEEELRQLKESYDGLVPPTRDLEQRILGQRANRAERSLARATWPRDLALTALLVMIIAGLGIGIRQLHAVPRPASGQPTPNPTATPLATPASLFTTADLRAAGIHDPSLVTPFDLVSSDNGQTITLIGAYADAAQTVLILRMAPGDALSTDVEIDDDLGLINAAASGGEAAGVPDYVYILEGGPHPDVHGLAHLHINVSKLARVPQLQSGQWNFSIDLQVHASTPIPAPNQFRAGALAVTVEAFEQTPTVIHFRAVINGTDVPGASNAVSFVDPTGKVIGFGCAAGITVPKQSLMGPPTSARVNCEFPVPRTAGTYQIRVAARGGTYLLPIQIRVAG